MSSNSDNKRGNPLGTDGYEFVEFTAPDAKGIEQLHSLFKAMGFAAVAKHRSKDVTLYRQGDINFMINATPYTHFHQFAQAHGPCACAMGWRVKAPRPPTNTRCRAARCPSTPSTISWS